MTQHIRGERKTLKTIVHKQKINGPMKNKPQNRDTGKHKNLTQITGQKMDIQSLKKKKKKKSYQKRKKKIYHILERIDFHERKVEKLIIHKKKNIEASEM